MVVLLFDRQKMRKDRSPEGSEIFFST